jgi:hypothetical protein
LRGRIWGFEDEPAADSQSQSRFINPGEGTNGILSPIPSVIYNPTPASSVRRKVDGLPGGSGEDAEDEETTPIKNTKSNSTSRPLPTPSSANSSPLSNNSPSGTLSIPVSQNGGRFTPNGTLNRNPHAFITGTNPSNAGSIRVRGISGLLDDFNEDHCGDGGPISLLGDDDDAGLSTGTGGRMGSMKLPKHSANEAGSVRFKRTRVPSDHPNFPNGLPSYSSASSGSERSSSPEQHSSSSDEGTRSGGGKEQAPSPMPVLAKKNRGGRSLRVKPKSVRGLASTMAGETSEEGRIGPGSKGTKGRASGRVSLSRMMAGGLERKGESRSFCLYPGFSSHLFFDFDFPTSRFCFLLLFPLHIVIPNLIDSFVVGSTSPSRSPMSSPTKESYKNGRVKGMAESFIGGKEKLSFGEEGRRSRWVFHCCCVPSRRFWGWILYRNV